ncbi:D-2-hydroxyacid dehydrogenase [Skeletonema marinoi]|uniref:D-2-hydroxyacid dehydrogenase n=1 Tax=Skeletonema marinoi TaxID=267567 RepID=A0AAD9DIM1_9STRA|nr:D-2-hydroxyacid dehydrogenase [Skeletonema marinoi]
MHMNIPACYSFAIASLAPLQLRSAATAFRLVSYPSPRVVPTSLRPSVCVGNNNSLISNNSPATSLRMMSYWNRETCQPTSQYKGEITKEARILALCDPHDAYNKPLYDGPLPEGSKLLAVGSTLADFDNESIINQDPNVIFVSHPNARGPLVELLNKFPSVEWVHTRSAGVDFIASDGLFSSPVQLTNAKGMFSSTLAEYCMMACAYFAKDLPRLMRQKNDVNWEQYPVLEIRGATLGVVGFGDIGRSSAKLAKAYGMKVLGLKRSIPESFSDPYCDEIYDMKGLVELVQKSDYILIATPLTEQTRGLISKEVLQQCKKTAVIINVGRGPIIDEEALIEALTNGDIKGAGLDVMTVEPLPKDSQLWKLDNVLLSPHNMDMTLSFMQESTEFFINENLPRFVRGIELLNPVDKSAGY